MLWIHPVIQFTAFVLAVWTLALGVRRFLFAHLGRKVMFNWKRHVLLGKIVLGLWLAGLVLGVLAARWYWGFFNLTGSHFVVGMSMGPLLVLSLITGLVLEKPKGKRPALALTHGVSGALLFLMSLYQLYSGILVLRDYVTL